jgi:hypothetical protein
MKAFSDRIRGGAALDQLPKYCEYRIVTRFIESYPADKTCGQMNSPLFSPIGKRTPSQFWSEIAENLWQHHYGQANKFKTLTFFQICI